MKAEKDWADALREQCFPEEVPPSPGSWANISGKMHRRTVHRWGLAAVFAVLLPLGGILLFLPSPADSNPVAAMERPVLETKTELLATLPPAGQVRPILSRKAVRDDMVSEPAMQDAPSEESIASPFKEVTDTETSVTGPSIAGTESEEWLPAEAEPSPPRKKRISVTVQAGSATGRRDTYPMQEYVKKMSVQSKAANLYWNNLLNVTEIHQLHYRHDLPLSVGLSVRWDFSSRMALESGLTYTYLHSFEEQLGHQELHFVGIQLKLDIRLLSIGPLNIGVGMFGMAEKCLSAHQGGILYPEPTLQWSAGGFVDAGYRLGDHTTLYLQPSLSYYFTKTTLITYRTENPLSFTLQAGLRFNL